MADIPVVDSNMAGVVPREIRVAVRGDNVTVDLPVGMPMDVAWASLLRVASMLEREMQAQRVIEKVNELSITRSARTS